MANKCLCATYLKKVKSFLLKYADQLMCSNKIMFIMHFKDSNVQFSHTIFYFKMSVTVAHDLMPMIKFCMVATSNPNSVNICHSICGCWFEFKGIKLLENIVRFFFL